MTAPHPTTTNLDAALAYAARGWRVVPIPPGRKHPGIAAWQTAGTTDPDRIRHWWTQAPDHGIGIVTGAESGLWVLDIDVADGKAGDDTLAELIDAYGPIPDTHEVLTGSGGRHLYFAWPTNGTIVRNSAGNRLGPGIDVRGEGGQVLAPPTIHPNGRPYVAEASAPDTLAPAPGWLLAMLEDAEPAPAVAHPQPLTPTSDRPGDLWAATVTWDQLLTADGWTKTRPGPDGEDRWVRPGKDARDGISATVGYKGSDVLKVFTSSHPVLQADATYSRFAYLAAMRHGGDYAAAARWCRQQGHTPAATDAIALGEYALPDDTTPLTASDPQVAPEAHDDDTGDWAPLDLSAILSGDYNPPQPTICRPGDAPALFYPQRVNAIFGESGAGKTWLALAAIVEVLDAGGVAMLIDLEDTPHGIVSRLLALGVDRTTIAERFLYLAPHGGWGPVAQAALATMLAAVDIDLVVLDSTGEAMAAAGVKGNDDDDVARWFVHYPKLIAHQGPAVIIIDHVPKDPNAPSRYMIGSQRKTAAINGASYRVDAIKAPSKDNDGVLKVICAKDRNGTRAAGHTAAMVHVDNTTDGVDVRIAKPDEAPHNPDGSFRPTIYMQRVSELLEATPGLSGREVESRVEGKAKHIREATRLLLVEGYIEQNPAARGFAYIVAKPYRSDADPTANPVDTSGSDGEVPCG